MAKILLGGHRGYGCTDNAAFQALRPNLSSLPVENTLESVQRAFAEGADFVEIDAIPTTDGQIAVVHNVVPADHFFSPNKPEAPLNTLPWEEIKSCPTGRNGMGQVCLLADMLACIAKHAPSHTPYVVNIELKGTQRSKQPWEGEGFIRGVAEVVKASPIPLGKIVFSSFALRNVVLMAKRLPTAQYGFLFYEKERPEDIYTDEPGAFDLQAHAFNEVTVRAVEMLFQQSAPRARLGYLHPEITTLSAPIMQTLVSQGYGFNTWGLLESLTPERLAHYESLKASLANTQAIWGIITDDLLGIKSHITV